MRMGCLGSQSFVSVIAPELEYGGGRHPRTLVLVSEEVDVRLVALATAVRPINKLIRFGAVEDSVTFHGRQSKNI